MSRIDYCITTMDRPQALERLLLSIAEHRPEAVIHVADQSERFDPEFHEELAERLTEAGLREPPAIHRLPFDCGVSAARNQLADVTSGDYMLVLDDDFVFTQSTDIDALMRLMDAHPEAGVAGGDVSHGDRSRISGCRLVKGAGTLHQLAADEPLESCEGIRFRRTDCVPVFMLLRRELCERVRWDPELKTAGEHFDFFLRVKEESSFTVLHAPDVVVEHHPARADPAYRRRRLRDDFLKAMLAKHGLQRQRAIGGAVFELLPDGELIAYCELRRRPPARHAGDKHTAVMSRQEFAAWLRRRIASRTPTAVVRLGDGERRLLRANADDAASMNAAKEQIERQAMGDPGVEQILEVKTAIEFARDEADVLGILGRGPFDSGKSAAERQMEWMKTLRSFWPRREAPDEPLALAGCHLHHDLLDQLPGMLADRKISVISCRDVKPVLEAKWGVKDVAVYQLPSESMTRGLDDAYESAMHAVPIWPDAHRRVVEGLTVREAGEVFLVGGGVFCKDLCVRVRDEGGIGIDLGSTLDHIAGRLARDSIRQLFELEAAGLSAPEIALRLRKSLGVPVATEKVRRLIDSVTPYVR